MAHRWIESIGCGCAGRAAPAPGSAGIAADNLQRITVQLADPCVALDLTAGTILAIPQTVRGPPAAVH
jgi:hypothetical protein